LEDLDHDEADDNDEADPLDDDVAGRMQWIMLVVRNLIQLRQCRVGWCEMVLDDKEEKWRSATQSGV
jgi:hypothetical protein